jgi:alkanesulfonate monooxygenase SsuD/methylene tetrahydromethanopterin reductase-like flavin-dependent oxidoreductase (luciferase family)
VRLGLGIAAGDDPGILAPLAAEAEALGYDSVWTNDNPSGDGLLQLQAWAQSSSRVRLCVGVLALDRHDPAAIAARVEELHLPRERLLLGLGAGFTASPLRAVREGVARVREALPGVHLAVAAMGPGMCRLAGEVGDAVLLNWMTPERAAWARPLVRDGAIEAGKGPDDVEILAYVRTALGPDAGERLEREATMYMQMPHYARHFESMGVAPPAVGVAASSSAGVASALQEYSAVDEPVVRVLSSRSVPEVLAVARAAIGA